MPRPRFTLRWLMVAVAVVALCLGWIVERYARFRRTSTAHARLAAEMDNALAPIRIRSPIEEWHLKLAAKYQHAARYPWLPVAPDPPEPE